MPEPNARPGKSSVGSLSRETRLPISRGAAWAVLALCALAGGASAEPRETIEAHGLLAGDTLLLFAVVKTCGPEQGPPMAQIFASTDEGKTWVKRGPALEGSEFQYAAAGPDGVWVAGLHTAEGPGIDPFVLAPEAAPATGWTVRRIYEGPAELLAVARTRPGQLSALVKHIDIHDERWRGPRYLHRSEDDGRTWKAVGPTKATAPARGRFGKIGKRTPQWRITDRRDGGFDVQRRVGKLWQTTAEFPWRACD